MTVWERWMLYTVFIWGLMDWGEAVVRLCRLTIRAGQFGVVTGYRICGPVYVTWPLQRLNGGWVLVFPFRWVREP